MEKSKYSRAVSVKRTRRNDRIKLMIDPSLYKNNLQKFSDNTIDVKPKPLDQYIRCKKYQNISYIENERNAEGQNRTIPSSDKLPQSIIDSLKKLKNKSREQSNKVRLEAIKQRALEKKAEKLKITQALRKNDGSTKSKNHIIFSDNDLAPVSNNFNLFDSDEEYNYNENQPCCKLADIATNTTFDGESGRERLNLQKKFRSDDRFKLTSDFVSDDENIDTDENNIKRRQTRLES
ncbi:hypothetical protein C2G38_2052447 [Gigaspora rosea]|uniref:Uncharacterized protein n=1 Tax=Gigaspora rosea TaxID=44941 RepID=A0A397W926_9GLOM|nr:hypothetical protein C2G38_2052447 [Gigaspora rosea]